MKGDTKEFKFADLGEGITEGELIKWFVAEGESVKKDQVVLEVETDKALVEIPSPYAGTIERLHVQEGDIIKVGQTLITYREPGEPPEEGVPIAEAVKSLPPHKGLGKRPVTAKEVRHRIGQPALATPHVRRLAREQGIDIEKLIGSGPEGRITEEDLGRGGAGRLGVSFGVPGDGEITVEQVAKWGPIKRIPLHGTRRKIAIHMMQAARMTAPVTHIDEVDVTKLVALCEAKQKEAARKQIKLTLLPFILRAVVQGLKKYPSLNASLIGDEVVYKEFYNIGFAVDVEESLIVPVIKNVDRKSFDEIATELQELAGRARARTINLTDLKGSSFSVTNLGSIGGRYFTPIINYPDGAILGLGRIHQRPRAEGGQVYAKPVMSLNLTFDHRVTDGATGARFTNYLIEQLENPDSLL